MKSDKTINKKEDSDEVYSHMLEMYTVVPPSPLSLKKKRKPGIKKNKKIPGRKHL